VRVLITGGAGYVGTSLISNLLQTPGVSEVTVYDSLRRGNLQCFFSEPAGKSTAVFRFVHGDILDTRTLSTEVSRADTVIHLAAHVTTPFADHDAHQFEQINHWGTALLVDLVEQMETKRFIYISSVAIYGASPSQSTIETRPNPTTFYGISKQRAELHVERLLNQTHTLILRCGNVYGFNRSIRIDSVINNFMFQAHFGQKGRVIGDGSQHRAFVEVSRLGRALAELSTNNPLPSGTYNLVERSLTVGEVVDSIREIYPNFETVYVDQGMPMRNLEIEPDPRIPLLSNAPPLLSDLTKFQSALR